MHLVNNGNKNDAYKRNIKRKKSYVETFSNIWWVFFIHSDQFQTCQWIKEFNPVKSDLFLRLKLWRGKPLEFPFLNSFTFVKYKANLAHSSFNETSTK